MATVRKFDVVTPRPKLGSNRDEIWWHRLGNAAENERGQITIWLNSLPIPNNEGNVTLNLFEKKDEDQQETRGNTRSNVKGNAAGKYNKPSSSKDDMDDEIKF